MQKTIRRRAYVTAEPLSADLPPLLDRIYRSRGVRSAQELEHRLAHLHHPQLKGLDRAVELLADAVEADAIVVIVGDFDADGATSCALAVRSEEHTSELQSRGHL